MNVPKVNMGLSQRAIDECARDAPAGKCKCCRATEAECVECQKYIWNGGAEYES